MWIPDLSNRPGRAYQALCDAIADAIAQGDFAPGDRLPPQRELAYALNISVGTVGRAYARARKQGLIGGEVGRGTYVRDPAAPPQDFALSPAPYTEYDSSRVDLRRNLPAPVGQEAVLRQALDMLAQQDLRDYTGYSPPGGTPAHRTAGAQWIARAGLSAPPERVLVTAGASQAVATAFAAAIRRPGHDPVILCEPLINVGFKDTASTLNIRLKGVEMDEYGICPDALARACEGPEKPAALLVVPTFQNPTTALMPTERRIELVAIARRYELALIEDDLYADLLPSAERLLPLTHYYPEASFYVTSLSKSVTPGIRIGYLLCPDVPTGTLTRRCQGILNSFAMDVPLLMGGIATWLIESGEAARFATKQAQEMAARQTMAAQRLADHSFRHHPAALHFWLQLPPQWRTHSFTQACLAQGVHIGQADDFAVGQTQAPHCVRLALGAPQSHAELGAALNTVASLLNEQPQGEIPGV